MDIVAPAKINLDLRVARVRGDGFHPLASWMVTVGLFDSMNFERVAEQGVTLVCESGDVPIDDRNLIVRSGNAFARELAASSPEGRCSFTGSGARVVLHKRIAVGAGLGGGSSDAAHTLMALNRLWESHWPVERLRDFSAQFGSDVPFFFAAPSAMCRGRGEIIEPMNSPTRARWAVLLLPRMSISTAEAYRRFDAMQLGRDPQSLDASGDVSGDAPNPRWADLPAEQLLPLLKNDLEPAAFAMAPQLGKLRQDAQDLAGRPVRMSGSGSSLFTLFDEQPSARDAAGRIASQLRVRSIAVVVGPSMLEEPSVASSL